MVRAKRFRHFPRAVEIRNRFYIIHFEWYYLASGLERETESATENVQIERVAITKSHLHAHNIVYGTYNCVLFMGRDGRSLCKTTYYTTLNTIYAHIWAILVRMGCCAPRVLRYVVGPDCASFCVSQ